MGEWVLDKVLLLGQMNRAAVTALYCGITIRGLCFPADQPDTLFLFMTTSLYHSCLGLGSLSHMQRQ